MAALTANRNTPQIDEKVIPELVALPMAAATTIFAGSIVCVNAAGYAVPMTTATTLKAVGVAIRQVVNPGAAGGAVVEVRRGAFPFDMGTSGDALTIADRYTVVYGSDDHTVNKTNGGATRSAVGLLQDVIGTQAVVLVGSGITY